MATAWVRARSLSCKSRAVADDVYSPPGPPPLKKHPPPTVKSSALLSPAKESRGSRSSEQGRPATRNKKTKDKSEELAKTSAKQQFTASPMASPKRPSSGSFLEMTELPEGHPSRRVVELIFATGWGRADRPDSEPEVEALFRVRSTARAVARFEDARAAAQARGAAASDARCAADGNETMRFQCRAADNNEVICAAVATTKVSAVRTFASSGAADASAAGGPGRRGMLVCRVITGRVRRAADPPCRAGEYHSVDAGGGGELLVLDRRAVLPCFLVVYTVKPALERSSSCGSR